MSLGNSIYSFRYYAWCSFIATNTTINFNYVNIPKWQNSRDVPYSIT